nr:Chain C, KB-1753 phage display peptide [synthetic construct]2G83_D Chain D, KB-1753 phage display peptide [synthetic construct]
RGYYHGIWVGE